MHKLVQIDATQVHVRIVFHLSMIDILPATSLPFSHIFPTHNARTAAVGRLEGVSGSGVHLAPPNLVHTSFT